MNMQEPLAGATVARSHLNPAESSASDPQGLRTPWRGSKPERHSPMLPILHRVKAWLQGFRSMAKPTCAKPAAMRLQKVTRVPSKASACRTPFRRSRLRLNVTDSRQRLRLGLGNEARPTARSELRISPDGRVHQVLATFPVLPRAQGREREPCRPSLCEAVTFTQVYQFFWFWTLGLHDLPRYMNGRPPDD